MQHRVIVVGAAVAGSAVANAFGQAGIPTLILEKGAERDNSTRGDILHPPTLAFRRGMRGDLLKQPDPALHEYVASRVPQLASARFGRKQAHVYSLSRQLADRFCAPGAALVGDSAYVTHPAGATGMNLAISGAVRLAEMVGPLLQGDRSTASQYDDLDAALAAYDAERRPAAESAIEANHQQSLRLWPANPHDDPQAYATGCNPASGWGARGAGWGQNPAALAEVGAGRHS